MVDYIKIVALIDTLFSYNSFKPFEWRSLMFYPKFTKGKLRGFESEYNGFRVFLYYDRIELSNSIHKFYKGNNYTDFTLSELKDTINTICVKFGIEANRWNIKKLEFGFNILTPKKADHYLNLIYQYKNREFEKMKAKHLTYGKKCFMSEYAIKIYDKYVQTKIMYSVIIPENTLRVEFCYNQKRKLPKQIKTLSDLQDKEKFKELYNDLNEAINIIIFNDEVDVTSSTIEERILFFASFNPNLLKVEETISKVEAKEMKLKIKLLKERFLSKNFKLWLLKTLSSKYIELYCS
jgi:hypothetical protein